MNKKIHQILGLLLAMNFLIGACGQAGTPVAQESPQQEGEPEATMPAEPEPTEAPPEGEEPVVLRVTWEGDFVDCLNPASCFDAYEMWEQTMDGMTGYTAIGEPASGRIVESWEISDDHLTWTFHLRDLAGATFHDGTPLDAEAVAWSLNYWAQNEAINWYYFTELGDEFGAEVIDDRTVVLRITEPMAEGALADALNYIYMLPRHVWEQYDGETIYDFENRENIGTGPFRLTELELGSHVILDAHENYFMGKPPVDRIIIQSYETHEAEIQALIAGEVDMVTNVQPAFVDELETMPEITLITKEPIFEHHLFLNMMEDSGRHSALADLEVRKAIAHAINKQQLVDVVFEGRAYAADNLFDGGGRFEMWSAPDVEAYAFDLDTANRILDAAGYLDTDGDGVREMNDGSGLPLEISLIYDINISSHLGMSEMIADWIRELDIEVSLEGLDKATQHSVMWEYDYDVSLYKYAHTWDPEYVLFTFTCAGIDWFINFPGYCDEDYENAYYAQHIAWDQTERREAVFEVQRILHEDIPYIQLLFPIAYEAYRNDRFTFNITDSNWHSWGWYGIYGVEPVR